MSSSRPPGFPWALRPGDSNPGFSALVCRYPEQASFSARPHVLRRSRTSLGAGFEVLGVVEVPRARTTLLIFSMGTNASVPSNMTLTAAIPARGTLSPMANPALSRRVEKVVAYPPLSEMSDLQRRELHEALLDADTFEIWSASGRRQS
jgi:hypothetical protein